MCSVCLGGMARDACKTILHDTRCSHIKGERQFLSKAFSRRTFLNALARSSQLDGRIINEPKREWLIRSKESGDRRTGFTFTSLIFSFQSTRLLEISFLSETSMSRVILSFQFLGSSRKYWMSPRSRRSMNVMSA
ncbi:hypothetical protein M405DRAFT_196197 [Rhizopogon salebrosus TDB-379]|nr:hypothetical protein M405DRAFT_196197 [Rhizopogon salebrosus TDB-379]